MSKNNIEIVSALYEAFAHRDLPGIFQAIDPQITVSQSEQLPWGGTFQGHEGLRFFLTKLLQYIDSKVDVSEYVDVGNQIIALGRTHGHVKASGVQFDVRAVHIWTIKDGKIVRFEPYIDTPKMIQALKGQ